MTKKLTFKIKAKPYIGLYNDEEHVVGKSVYVRYYNDNFEANFKKLFPNDPVLEDKIDKHTDFKYFLTKHEVKCIWLGRGVDLRDKYSIEVFENDKVLKLLSDKIFEINELDIGSYSYDDALKKDYVLRYLFIKTH